MKKKINETLQNKVLKESKKEMIKNGKKSVKVEVKRKPKKIKILSQYRRKKNVQSSNDYLK